MILRRMKVRQQQDAHGWSQALTLPAMVALIVMAPVVHAQLNRTARGRNIVFPEYYEKAVLSRQQTNQLKGRLTLMEGEYLPSGLILGKTMQLDQYTPDGHTNLVARAPECLFNPTNRAAWSTGRLEIVAMDGRFIMSGNEGFEASLTNTTLTLSNRVRTVFKQSVMKPLPSLP
jgi:hypothetical protein